MADFLSNKLNDLIDAFDNTDYDDLQKFSINLENGVNSNIITDSIKDLEKMESSFDFQPDEDYINPFDINLKNKIDIIIDDKKNKFKINQDRIFKQISYYNDTTEATNNLNKLNTYNNQNNNQTTMDFTNINNNSNLNYRKGYYQYQQIENVKYANTIFNYIYYLFLLIFVFYTLIKLKDYKSPVTWTIILVLILLPILIMPLFVKLLFNIYDYFIDLYDTKMPKDVFTNI